jgi:hypothetical protein
MFQILFSDKVWAGFNRHPGPMPYPVQAITNQSVGDYFPTDDDQQQIYLYPSSNS